MQKKHRGAKPAYPAAATTHVAPLEPVAGRPKFRSRGAVMGRVAAPRSSGCSPDVNSLR